MGVKGLKLSFPGNSKIAILNKKNQLIFKQKGKVKYITKNIINCLNKHQIF